MKWKERSVVILTRESGKYIESKKNVRGFCRKTECKPLRRSIYNGVGVEVGVGPNFGPSMH